MADAPAPDAHEMDAFARARRTRVVVVGGGVAGLVAALEWAKIGAHVTVLEASDRFGGMLETVALDGLPVDAVMDAFPLDSSAFGALIDELRLRRLVEPAAPRRVWIAGLPGGGAAPLPAATVLGIPSNPWATDVRRVIGWRGAWRAYLDRLRPPLTIGHERSLGRLVRSRMGDRVVDRLVAPTTRGLYAVDPDEIDVEVAAPGLSTALTRTGSLAGAAFDLLPADPSAPIRATLQGGLGVLVAALVERLHDLGADLRTGSEVVRLARGESWTASLAVPPTELSEAATANDHVGPDLDTEVEADVVVVATEAATAARLLESASVATPVRSPVRRDVVTLVVEAPDLAAAPRGRTVYFATADGPAVAVAQPTADWPWLAVAAGATRQVLRVTLPIDPARTDAERVADAARAAEAALGVLVGSPRAAVRRSVDASPPASVLDHEERVRAIRSAAGEHPGLVIVGAWVAGSGLAQVVTDAVTEVDRARRAVLWGGADHPADGDRLTPDPGV